METKLKHEHYTLNKIFVQKAAFYIFFVCVLENVFLFCFQPLQDVLYCQKKSWIFFFYVFAFNEHPKVAQCCDFLCSLHINHYPTTYDYSKLTDDETSFNSVSDVRNPSYFYFSCTFKLYNTFHYVKRLLSTFWPYQNMAVFHWFRSC